MREINTNAHQQMAVRGEHATNAVGISEDGRIQWLATGERMGDSRKGVLISVAAGEMVQSAFEDATAQQLSENEIVQLRAVSA